MTMTMALLWAKAKLLMESNSGWPMPPAPIRLRTVAERALLSNWYSA